MPRVTASRELLAPREDVWRFLEEPHHLPDWWPGVAGVDPGRRGLVAGARWQLRGDARPSLLRRAGAADTLAVREVEPPERVVWYLTRDRIEVELRLEDAGPERTCVHLAVSGLSMLGPGRSLPRRALARLHDPCQTAARM